MKKEVGWIVLLNKGTPDRRVSEYKDGDTKRDGTLQYSVSFCNKFYLDTCIEDTDEYFVLNDGVILNSSELYGRGGIKNYIFDLINKGDYPFIRFRGPFSGIIYRYMPKELIAWTNHTGEKAVYYYEDKNMFIVGTSLYKICETLRMNGITYTFDESTANCILTYGHIYGNRTFISQIKRLRAGEYLKYTFEGLHIKTYWKLERGHQDIDEDEAIETIEDLFCRAVKLEYEKDREYGYEHLVLLSGGLDSRMGCMVANEKGFTDQTAVHFGNGRYFEESIARNIAIDLGMKYIYRMNNDLEYVYSPEMTIKTFNGGTIYTGIGNTKLLPLLVQHENYGIIHGGQLGDAVIGASLAPDGILMIPGNSKIESKIIAVEKDKLDFSMYDDNEIENLYERGFFGALQTHQFIQQYTESCSPFLYPELIEYCYSLPIKMRYDHEVYRKWILKKHPKAAAYIWEKTGQKITGAKDYKDELRIKLKPLIPESFLKVRREFFERRRKKEMADTMNPYAKWYLENGSFRVFIKEYYQNKIRDVEFLKKTHSDCNRVFEDGDGFEKLFVIHVLAAYQVYMNVDNFEEGKV